MPELSRAVRTSAIAAAVVLGVLGAGLTGVALTGAATSPPPAGGEVVADDDAVVQPPPSRPRTQAQPDRRPRPGGVRDRITGPVLPESHPTAVSIPRLDVKSELVVLRVEDSGAMEVPVRGADAGWYALGPTPGALGPAVIAGHVTWDQSPAVFFDLKTLGVGDVVNVSRADGRTAVFSVDGVETHAKDRFPTEKVFGTIDHAGLRLITCGGTYDSAANRYLDNVVVFATLVDVV